MSIYDAVYFVGDNQANNRVRIGPSKTSNRGAFSDSFAALQETPSKNCRAVTVHTCSLILMRQVREQEICW